MNTCRCMIIAVVACIALLVSCAGQEPESAPPEETAESQPAEQSAQTEQAEPEAEAEGAQPGQAQQPAAETKPEPAQPATQPSSAAGDAAAGAALYSRRCATCHGAQGQGNENMARMLKVEIRELGSAEVQAKSDAELARNITQGTGKMTAVSGLSEADVTNLVAFLRTLN